MKTVLLPIPVPEDWRDILKAEAAKRGMTLADWAREALAEKLPAKTRAKLSAPPKMGRPKKTESDDG